MIKETYKSSDGKNHAELELDFENMTEYDLFWRNTNNIKIYHACTKNIVISNYQIQKLKTDINIIISNHIFDEYLVALKKFWTETGHLIEKDIIETNELDIEFENFKYLKKFNEFLEKRGM